MQLADIPFGYMYVVRLRTPARAVRLILAEWLPLATALWVTHLASFWLTIMMLAGSFAVYEVGYFVNDLADSSADPNGDHLKGRRIHCDMFFGSHAVFFSLVIGSLVGLKGCSFAGMYGLLAVLVLLLFFWHTSRRPRRLPFLRLFTFTALSLYKFVPVVIPLLSRADSQAVLFALFFCWGFWRVLSYALIKFGKKELTSLGQDFDPCRLFHLFSLILFSPFVIAVRPDGAGAKAAFAIWLAHFLLAVLRTAHQLRIWRIAHVLLTGARGSLASANNQA